MGRKTRAFLQKLGKAIDGVDKAIKKQKAKKTVIKAAVKPKVMTQTPCGMANSTKSSPYIPPTKKTCKPNL